MRCAYYGNADLTLKEMEAGHERDGSAYVFATLQNDDVLFSPDKRRLFEEGQLNHDLRKKYLRHFDFLKKRNPRMQATSRMLRER